MDYLFFSIIIPSESIEKAQVSLDYVKQLNYPSDKLEIILSIGKQPALQRNLACYSAKGDILYFLDSDSMVNQDNLLLLNEIFQNNISVCGVGGPNIVPDNDSFIQKSFGEVFGSLFGVFSTRFRTVPFIKTCEADENMLILCNLAIRKDKFISYGGLNEVLYPNEENEFVNRLRTFGEKFLYSPKMTVYRSQRKSVKEFFIQNFRYGLGRMSQNKVSKFYFCYFRLIPLFFVIYLGLLPFFDVGFKFFPLILYGILSLLFSLPVAMKLKTGKSILVQPFLFFICHFAYGFGMIAGMINFPKKKPEGEFDVTAEGISVFFVEK